MAEKKEEFKVTGSQVKEKVRELIKQGNARKILIKNEQGEVVLEIPLTWGAIGVVLVPTLAAVGAIAAVLTNCTIVVVKKS